MTDQRVRRDFPTKNPPQNALKTSGSASDEIRQIAALAARLTPYSGDPERFFLRKEDVVTRLLALANAMEGEQ